MIKGLKPGTSYKVRVVARDPADPAVHSTEEVLVTVPGEAACLRIDGLCILFCLFRFPITFLLCLIIRHTALQSDMTVQ